MEVMNKDNKRSTSIQYQISNRMLLDNVFYEWNKLNEILNKGPEEMKKYLLEMWNKLRDILINDENIIIKDIDKRVTISNFDVTYNKTKNGTNVFFITFPDYDYTDAASKYVALALTPDKPKYYTLEYSKKVIGNTPCWIIGEFIIEGSKYKHVNYGTTDNMRLSWFAGYILGKLESENL